MAYQELIKNFDKIRDYMREFYIYGFKTRMEYGQKSSRSYDNEKRRIESWLGSYTSNRSDAKGKHVSLSLNPRELSYNPLYQAYKAKSFTDRDITLHFYLLDILAEMECCSASGIYEEILRRMPEGDGLDGGGLKGSGSNASRLKTSGSGASSSKTSGSGASSSKTSGSGASSSMLSKLETSVQDWSLDESTLRKKLKEYENLGLITSEKAGRDRNYRISKEYLPEDFPPELLHFASETFPLGVIASYLQDQSAFLGKENDSGQNQTLRFLHHNLIHTFDQEVLYQLLLCRSKKKKAILTAKSESSNHLHDHHVFPLAFFCSVDSGREYLFAYSFTDHQYRMFRLDHIRKVKEDTSMADFVKYEQKFQEIRKYLWGVSLKRMDQNNLEHVEMVIRISPGEDYILKRLIAEKRCGEVKKLVDYTDYPELSPFAEDTNALWIFICDIYDARELLPWARSFLGSVLLFRCSNHEITEIFYQDLEEMKRIYLQEAAL